MASFADGEPSELFWLADRSTLLRWSAARARRSRFWIARAGESDPEPIGELPPSRREGWQVLGLPRLEGPWTCFVGRLPDAAGFGFAPGPPLNPTLHRDGDVVLRWEPGPWQSLRICGLEPVAGAGFRPALAVPAAVGSWKVPPEWLGGGPLELIVTPVAADNRRGPTEWVVVAPLPPEARVQFEVVHEAGSGQWFRVRVVNSGPSPIEVGLQVQSPFGRPPDAIRLTAEAGGSAVHEYRDVMTRDRIRAEVQGGSSGLVRRFFFSSQDTPSLEIAAQPDAPEACSCTFPSRPAALPARHEQTLPPGEHSGLIDELLRSPTLEGLGRPELAGAPGGVLLVLRELAHDPGPWTEAAETLGTPPADLAADFLRRPQAYALLCDPAVRAFARAGGGIDHLRSVPDLILGDEETPAPAVRVRPTLFGAVVPEDFSGLQTGPGQSLRDSLYAADDEALDGWLAGLAAGVRRDVLADLVGRRRWRCPPDELSGLAAALRVVGSDPIQALAAELVDGARPPWPEVQTAARDEGAARATSASPEAVRTAAESRRRALDSAAEALEAIAGATARADRVGPAVDALRRGEVGLAVGHLMGLRAARLGPAPPTAGMRFRFEAVWAAEAAERAEAARRAELTAAAWALDLLRSQSIPPWPSARAFGSAEVLPGLLEAEWNRWTPRSRQSVPPPAELRKVADIGPDVALAAARASVEEGPVSRVLDEMARASAELAAWLAIPPAQEEARRHAEEAFGRLRTADGRIRAVGLREEIEAMVSGTRPDWAALDRLQILRELPGEEEAWLDLGRALRDAGLLPTEVPVAAPRAVAAWAQSRPTAVVSTDRLALDLYLAAAGVPDLRPESTSRPIVRHLLPGPYALAVGLLPSGAGPFGRGDDRRRSLVNWLADGFAVDDPDLVVEWLLAEDGRLRTRIRADSLAQLPELWDALRWLTLDGFDSRREPSLSAFLAVPGPLSLLREPRARDLAARLHESLVAARDLRGLLDEPDELAALVNAAARLREEIGPDRMLLADLREYLRESLAWQLRSEGRRAGPADVEDELRNLSRPGSAASDDSPVAGLRVIRSA